MSTTITWESLGAALRAGDDVSRAIRERCAVLSTIDELLHRPYRIDHERLEYAVGVVMAARAALSIKPLIVHLVSLDEQSLQLTERIGIDSSIIPLTKGSTLRFAALRLMCSDVPIEGGIEIPPGPYTADMPGEWARCAWELWNDF